MIVGVSTLRLRIPGARSLKEKRSAVRPVVERIRRIGASCAEVGAQDAHQAAVLGVAVVASDGPTADRMLSAAVAAAENGRSVVLEDVMTERR
jgi:uncharacterized protein YlxP (DUF503 family)